MTALAAVVAVLAISSGAIAARKYMITTSSQIKPGVIQLSNLSASVKNRLAGLHGKNGAAGQQGLQGDTGPAGQQGPKGDPGPKGPPGISDYEIFSTTQSFGPGGIGGAWCGAPNANASDVGWRVIGGGAQLTDDQIDAGVAVANSWPNTTDPDNPGWNVRLNKLNTTPGDVTVYAVCVKIDN
jgi:hypothetical protein